MKQMMFDKLLHKIDWHMDRRMLVGRRELGEVKHDYVVRMNST